MPCGHWRQHKSSRACGDIASTHGVPSVDVSSATFSAATETQPHSSMLCPLWGLAAFSCRLIAGAAHTPWMRLPIFKAMSIRAERRHTDVEIVVVTPISDGGNNVGAHTKAGTLALMLRPRSMRLSAGVPAGITGDKKTPCHKTPLMLTGDGENTWDAARLPGAGMALVGGSGLLVGLWCAAAQQDGQPHSGADGVVCSCGYAAAAPAGGGVGEKGRRFSRLAGGELETKGRRGGVVWVGQ